MRAKLLALAFLLTLATPIAQADIGLAMLCSAAQASTQAAACTGARSWGRPGPSDYVLSHPTVPTDSTTVSWNDPNLQYRQWISIPGNYGVLTCAKDLSATQAPIVTADNCAPGGDAAAKVFVSASAVVIATVPPPVSPSANVGKPVTLDWAAPTLNEDGSALTNLAGFNIYQGATAATLTKIAGPLSAGTTTYQITGLAPGTYLFAVTAVSSAGIEGDFDLATYTRAQTKPGKVTVTVTVSAP